MSLILIVIGILAVIGMFMCHEHGFNDGYSVGHNDGFGHAKGWHLPPLDELKDFDDEVEELMGTRWQLTASAERQSEEAERCHRDEAEQAATGDRPHALTP